MFCVGYAEQVRHIARLVRAAIDVDPPLGDLVTMARRVQAWRRLKPLRINVKLPRVREAEPLETQLRVVFTDGKELVMQQTEEVQMLAPIDRVFVLDLLQDPSKTAGVRAATLHEMELDALYADLSSRANAAGVKVKRKGRPTMSSDDGSPRDPTPSPPLSSSRSNTPPLPASRGNTPPPDHPAEGDKPAAPADSGPAEVEAPLAAPVPQDFFLPAALRS